MADYSLPLIPEQKMTGNTSTLSLLDYPQEFIRTINAIEMSFDEKRVIPWMRGHWQWSFYYSAMYLFLIYVGQKYMQNKPAYNLRRALCCWSTGLCLFSCYSLYRIYHLAYYMIYTGGLQHAICDIDSYVGSRGGGLWAFLFPLSKLPELVDTVFIVLRKQKMVFLHWYHHVTVFIYCWFSYAFPISTGIWFGIVNFSVHALMYAYYAVKASGRTPPRWVAKSITTIQLSQMFVGIILNYLATKALLENKTCEMNPFAIGISIFFYVSYAILFANFYYWTYIHKRPSKKSTTEKDVSSTANGVSNGFSAHLNGSAKHSRMENGKIPRLNGRRSHIQNGVGH